MTIYLRRVAMMVDARHAAWLLLLVTACFHPSYDRPTCGPGGECPDGYTCSALRICEGADAAIRPPDAVNGGPSGTNLPSICDTADPNVIACYRFDGDTKDSSPDTSSHTVFPATSASRD